ncbi:MAG: type II toxin-antitoxin system Phd/YefM family antitoxin [Candidatus Binataceae bacterium]
MKSRISATEAARGFSELMNRVRYRRESFVVERGGKPICEIVPAGPAGITAGEFAELLRSLPHPGKEYLDLVEAAVRGQAPVEKPRWRR